MSDGTDGWLVSWAILLSAGVYIDNWHGLVLIALSVLCLLAVREGVSR